jgi:hypothetical protein
MASSCDHDVLTWTIVEDRPHRGCPLGGFGRNWLVVPCRSTFRTLPAELGCSGVLFPEIATETISATLPNAAGVQSQRIVHEVDVFSSMIGSTTESCQKRKSIAPAV